MKEAIEISNQIHNLDLPANYEDLSDVYFTNPDFPTSIIRIGKEIDSKTYSEAIEKAIKQCGKNLPKNVTFHLKASFVVELDYFKLCWIVPTAKIDDCTLICSEAFWLEACKKMGFDKEYHLYPGSEQFNPKVSSKLFNIVCSLDFDLS